MHLKFIHIQVKFIWLKLKFIKMGRIDEVKKEIIKFILNYKLDKN